MVSKGKLEVQADAKWSPRRWFSRSEIPLAVYLAIFSTMTILWVIQEVHEELTLGLFTELLGAAFTLFIIDTLLVRAKDKRWKVVRNHVDYLVGRNVNRLRDGITTRVFQFDPASSESSASDDAFTDGTMDSARTARENRSRFLDEIAELNERELLIRMDETALYTEDAYGWFNDKANDLWEIINMKYSEYMAPELVSSLIELHTRLKDVCSHIRQYRKGDRFTQNQAFYRQVARMGIAVSLGRIITTLNELKRDGYSAAASLGETPEADPEVA